MRLVPVLIALAFGTAPAAVLASEPAPAATEAAKPKKICRLLPARTGSHRPQGRVCKTAEEWRARDRDQYMQAPLEDTTKIEPVGPQIG
ncbi:MAG: hypothetical protein O9283_01265 [Sphingomonadaceae bacterium]|jgi:hypothetical protein|nr:hypothetical protein [Sphingomonadaceae bacterium]